MGKVINDFSSSYDMAFAVLIQADGKIVAAGCTSSNAQTDFLVVRYNADGQLDGTFGQNGLVITDFAQGQDCAYAMALQPDGKIVLVGETFYANDHAAIAVARYDQNGQLDVSFNQTGQLITDVNHYQDRAYAVAVQLDGKLVLAGMTATSHSSDFLVMRYNADGSRDPLFGNNGIVTTDVFGGYDAAHALAIQSDNTIVAVGEVWDNQADFGLVHYKSDGTLDTTFGSSGKVRTDFSRSDDYGCSVAIQQDGRIIVVGQITSASGDYDFGLARYLTSLSADTPTTTPTSTPPTITATPTSMPPSGDEHQTFLPAIRR